MVERIYDLLAVVVLFAANLLWLQPPANALIEFDRVRIVGVVLLVVGLSRPRGGGLVSQKFETR